MKILHTGKDELVTILHCKFCESLLALDESDIKYIECTCMEPFSCGERKKSSYCRLIGGHGFIFTCGNCNKEQKPDYGKEGFKIEKTLALLLLINGNKQLSKY